MSGTVDALKDINIDIKDREFVVILGKSGSGKSSLLNILGSLDYYDDGELIIFDKSTKTFNQKNWNAYRNSFVGFIFQDFYLVETLTVRKNVALALELQGFSKEKIKDRKSTRLNSSHVRISYAVFCLKKKNKHHVVNACYRYSFLYIMT